MITNYLIELLKDNDCVIVPGFGAFISKRHSATIDYANHRFTPPYKEIVFNNKLKSNDEILIKYIGKKENISTEEAYVRIQSFVNQSEAILDVNNELTIDGLGKIRKFGNDYVLTTNTDINLFGDSFGLTDFNVQPVFRTETYQVIKEKIVIEQKQKNTDYTVAIESVEEISKAKRIKRPGLVKTFGITTLSFLLLFAFNWKTEQSESNLASWNPFLYSSPNEFLINFIETENIESQQTFALEPENLKTSEPENIESQQSTDNSQQTVINETDNIVMPEPHYFIVGGSFQAMDRAEICLNDIKKQGFENASLLEKNDKGYIRVYYESFAIKSDALIRLETIKNDYNESAWLLFQK